MSLVFYPKSHRYKLDGQWVRGVTGLIGSGLPKPALIKWSANFVAQIVADDYYNNRPDERDQLYIDMETAKTQGQLYDWLRRAPERYRDAKAATGTEVHEIAEKIIHGEPVAVPDRLLGHVTGYVKWLDAFGVEPILTEQSVGSRTHQYAGRVDSICKIAGLGGGIFGVDWKTSNNVYSSTALQTAAYLRAEFTVTDDDPETELSIPKVDGNIVVHITEEGTKAHWLGRSPAEIDEAFDDFLAVIAVARRIDRIDGKWDSKLREAVGGYLSDPIELELVK